MATQLPDGKIEQFLRRNVCARCYGELTKRMAPDRLWEARCPTCGEAWNGATMRRTTAERRGQQALAEAGEVKANLPDLFPNPHRGRAPADILAELGF